VAACAGGGNTTSGVASLNGSNKPTATTNASGGRDDRQAAPNFARCTRQHGTDLPDPQFTADGGIGQPPPTGVARDDPRLRAAGRACGQSLPTTTSPVRNAVGLASEHAGDAHMPTRAAALDTDGLGSSPAPPRGRPLWGSPGRAGRRGQGQGCAAEVTSAESKSA
jgi:hypothetical protein